jgi:Protein of unknown function (DUF3300)
MPSGMIIRVLAGIIGLIGLIAVPLQNVAAQPAPNVPSLSAAQLDRLVAPIALYPDLLLAQLLMAATYPLEVVEADRWLQVPANAALKANELTTALQQQPWDPSVKSLIAFPRVLRMMDDSLDWTEQLGDAFLAQQADVMDAVQRLRRLAEAAGSLASGPQQTVAAAGPEVTIEPENPEIVYVPAYNPLCVYGTWPDTDYPPFSFGAWPGSCSSVLEFDGGIYPPFGFWAWGAFEWRRHHIRIDHDRFAHFHPRLEPPSEIWRHNSAHRHGVPYPNPSTAARFLGPAAAPRREFRGYAPTAAAPQRAGPVAPQRASPAAPSAGGARPPRMIGGGNVAEPRLPAPPQLPAAPIFRSFGGGAQVRSEAARGFSSRMSVPTPSSHAAPAPSFHAAPAPSIHAAPAPSFHAAPAAGFGGGGVRRR